MIQRVTWLHPIQVHTYNSYVHQAVAIYHTTSIVFLCTILYKCVQYNYASIKYTNHPLDIHIQASPSTDVK